MPVFNGVEISEEQLAEVGYVKTDLASNFSICTKHLWGSVGKAVCPQCYPPKQGRVTTDWGGKHGYFPPKPKFGRVKPRQGDTYYFINLCGIVEEQVWKGDVIDLAVWAMGNIYLTREAAKLDMARQRAKVRVIGKLAELKEHELDWSDTDQVKYALLINQEKSVVAAGDWLYYQFVEQELYSTKNAVEWVAEYMESDVILMLTGDE